MTDPVYLTEMPEMPNRELLRDIAKKYMTLTKEELQVTLSITIKNK